MKCEVMWYYIGLKIQNVYLFDSSAEITECCVHMNYRLKLAYYDVM
jgi:hypothetical protein